MVDDGTTNFGENINPDFEFLEKIKVLNLKKGDVVIIKYKAEHHNMPRHVYTKMMEKQIRDIKKFIKDKWGGKVGMIAIPDIIDMEVIRLEEWFV